VSARCQKRRLTCSCHTPHTVWSENQYACLDRNGSLSPEKATGGIAPTRFFVPPSKRVGRAASLDRDQSCPRYRNSIGVRPSDLLCPGACSLK
jgi:hypothetical protein